MSDNFNTAYMGSRTERQQPRVDAMLAELDAMSQEPTQGTFPAPRQAPAPLAPIPSRTSSPNPVAEGLKAVGGGVADAVRNSWNAIDDAATWLDNNFLDLRMGASSFGTVGGAKKSLSGQITGGHKEQLQLPELPEWSKNETTGGNIGRSAIQFLTPFLGATKVLRYGGVAVKAAPAVAGAVADFAAFDPHEKRLSNMVMDFADGNPAIGKPIFEYLAADPSDTAMEGRFKNTIEGLGLGMAVDGIFKGFKAVRSYFGAKGVNPAQAIQEAAAAAKEDLTAHAMDTSKAPDMALADQIDLLSGVRREREVQGAAKHQKRLDVLAAVKDADAAPKGPTLAEGALPTASKESNPDAFLKGNRELKLEDPSAIPFEGSRKEVPAPSFPEQWKMVAEDPAPRKLFLDAEDGHVVLSKEATSPTQMDLDLALPDILKKEVRTEAEDTALQGYKELQEKMLDKAPEGSSKASATAVGTKALDDRIAAAQARVDALLESGGNTDSAQRVLDSLLKKKDAGLFDHSSALGSKQADKLASSGDPLVDAIAANDEKLSAAFGRQEGGFISPSMLANMVAAQAGGVTGYMSAEDDATMAEKLSLAGVGALAGLGIKVGLKKVLKGHERAIVDAPHPAVESLARKEVGNIAPLSVAAKKLPMISAGKVSSLVEAAKSGGMESLSKAVKESDFNFSHIDTSEDVKATIDAFSEVFEKETSLAKHGTKSFGEMKELAAELGAGEGSLKELYKGTDNLGGRILAHRALLSASAEQVTKLSKLAISGDADGILALRKHVALHASIQAQMKGVQTEVARALGQFRITSSSVDLAVNERNQLIEAMGGHAANIRFAQQLANITDPKQLNAVIRKGALARTQDAMFEAWVNGLLSGPTTHIVNMIGNSVVAIGSSAERLGAAMYGKVLRSGKDAVQMGEVRAHLFGMTEGMKDALHITTEGISSLKKAGAETLTGDFQAAKGTLADAEDGFGTAYRSFAKDIPILDSSSFGTKELGTKDLGLQGQAISAERFGIDQSSLLGHLADGLGGLIRTPGRFLTSADELFKTIHYRGELKAQAYRQGVSEGLEGDALFQKIAQLVEHPTPELSAQALSAAREGTFTSPLGKAGASFQQAISNTPGARYIVPFMRTPINIMKYVGERTPGLNILSSNVRAEFAAGGARRDMMLAKTTLGGSLYAIGASLAAQGLITGGGEKNQTAEKLGGAQPYSIKVGDTYYAFNRLDPVGMFLGLAADLSDISGHIDAGEMDGLASAAVLAISRNLVSKSYASGLVNAIDALSNPDTKGKMYLKNFAASWVPSAVNAVRKEDDPLVREVWTTMDAIKNRIPGFSKDLMPSLNLFGEEVLYKGGMGPDIASPIATSVESSNPAAREIARLNLDLQHPPRTIGGGSGTPGIDLDHKQYHRLVQLMGSEVGDGGFKGAVTRLIEDPAYQELPEDASNSTYREAKEVFIRKAFETSKRQATMQLLQEDPSLMAKFVQNKQNAGNALSGAPVLPF